MGGNEILLPLIKLQVRENWVWANDKRSPFCQHTVAPCDAHWDSWRQHTAPRQTPSFIKMHHQLSVVPTGTFIFLWNTQISIRANWWPAFNKSHRLNILDVSYYIAGGNAIIDGESYNSQQPSDKCRLALSGRGALFVRQAKPKLS